MRTYTDHFRYDLLRFNRTETELIKRLISSYFDIVKVGGIYIYFVITVTILARDVPWKQKNFTDLVPKTIMSFLVNAVKVKGRVAAVANTSLWMGYLLPQHSMCCQLTLPCRRIFKTNSCSNCISKCIINPEYLSGALHTPTLPHHSPAFLLESISWRP